MEPIRETPVEQHQRTTKPEDLGADDQEDEENVKEASGKQFTHIAEEPEFSQVQLHYIIDTAVQQVWAGAESQASRFGILQTVLDKVAISMKKAFPCEEDAGNKPIFTKTQVKNVLAIVSEECGKALKLALDNALDNV